MNTTMNIGGNPTLTTIPPPLQKLGFDQWFEDRLEPAAGSPLDVARVIAVHKERCIVTDGRSEVPAELIGRLRYSLDSPLDLPTVGDWVRMQMVDPDTLALIHAVLPRKSLLKRKTAGKRIDFQLIAANIDTALIVQGLDGNFNLRRLERYLVMANEAGIHPVAVLSKSDLLPAEAVADRVARIHTLMPQLTAVPLSNHSPDGWQGVRALMRPGQTYCLLGSSGVGKTTLLNNLVGESIFKTLRVRQADGKGRHATTGRQLMVLDNGAMVVDTPGMRELGNFATEAGLEDTFDEIAALANQCRFSDCTHDSETGCAVRQALQDGRLSEQRFRNYIKMARENRHYRMSYVDKRRKERQFSKHCKEVMKSKHRRPA